MAVIYRNTKKKKKKDKAVTLGCKFCGKFGMNIKNYERHIQTEAHKEQVRRLSGMPEITAAARKQAAIKATSSRGGGAGGGEIMMLLLLAGLGVGIWWATKKPAQGV